MNELKRIIFLGVLFLIGSLCVSKVDAEQIEGRTVALTIGTGSIGGVYFPTGGAICLNVNRILSKIEPQQPHCSVEPTVGSVYNISQLAGGELQLGIAQSDVVSKAWTGKSPFETPVKDLRSIISLYTETITLVARQDAGIKTLTDLKGKRINLGKRGSGTERTAQEIFGACGLGANDLAAVHNMGAERAAEALRTNNIDAFLYVVGHPNETIWNLSSNTKINFVELSGRCLDTMVVSNPYYVKALVPGELYQGDAVAVPTLGVKATLMTTADLPEELIYHVTRAVVEKLYRFRRLHPDFNSPNPKSLFEGLVAPLHLGAFRYFQEMRVLEFKNGSDDPGTITPELVMQPSGQRQTLKLGRDGPFYLSKQAVAISRPDDQSEGVMLRSTVAAAASSGGVIFWLVTEDGNS